MSESAIKLATLAGTQWKGRAELWLDPLGNEAETCDCTAHIGEDLVEYGWSFRGAPHTGRIDVRGAGAEWSDTWHQPTGMICAPVAGQDALLSVLGAYAAPSGPEWGWRTVLSRRPSGELVLQMTNITPWGEEGRAVRMVFQPA